jgi:hypothetical protein
MIVSDIYRDLKSGDVLGSCDDTYIFARLTEAVSLIANQGIVDPLIGEMDICVCNGCVTLPAEVGTPLGVNQGGQPTLMRDEWYQYHINGAGSARYTDWNYTDYLGRVSTFRDPSEPVKLVAEVENARDSQAELRVFGWDVDGKRIFTENADGDLEDGFLVPTVYGFSMPHPSAPSIARIDRVHKSVTNGFIRLIAVDPDDSSSHTLIGHYRPDETDPSYVRIRVPSRNWLRIKYRKKNFEVRSTADWVNVNNREVLILATKAVHLRRKGQYEAARTAEGETIRILNSEADALRPPGITPPQVIWADSPSCDSNDRLIY